MNNRLVLLCALTINSCLFSMDMDYEFPEAEQRITKRSNDLLDAIETHNPLLFKKQLDNYTANVDFELLQESSKTALQEVLNNEKTYNSTMIRNGVWSLLATVLTVDALKNDQSVLCRILLFYAGGASLASNLCLTPISYIALDDRILKIPAAALFTLFAIHQGYTGTANIVHGLLYKTYVKKQHEKIKQIISTKQTEKILEPFRQEKEKENE